MKFESVTHRHHMVHGQTDVEVEIIIQIATCNTSNKDIFICQLDFRKYKHRFLPLKQEIIEIFFSLKLFKVNSFLERSSLFAPSYCNRRIHKALPF